LDETSSWPEFPGRSIPSKHRKAVRQAGPVLRRLSLRLGKRSSDRGHRRRYCKWAAPAVPPYCVQSTVGFEVAPKSFAGRPVADSLARGSPQAPAATLLRFAERHCGGCEVGLELHRIPDRRRDAPARGWIARSRSEHQPGGIAASGIDLRRSTERQLGPLTAPSARGASVGSSSRLDHRRLDSDATIRRVDRRQLRILPWPLATCRR